MSCGCSEVRAAESKSLINPLVTAAQITAITFPLWLTFLLIWNQTKAKR
jgi:hypothetical protein